MIAKKISRGAWILRNLSAASLLVIANQAMAQSSPTSATPATGQATTVPPATQTADNETGLPDIVVTATKRAGETVQTVPLAITAFDADQLSQKQFRSLDTIAFSAPNVQLTSQGTTPGFANVSIRGLGINSSVLSIDPTVGIFVDGVYQGINAGALFDTFDIGSIEILRGPQGLLFGKNVIGGAVLLRTSTPTDKFSVDAKTSIESGPSVTASAVVSGPLTKTLFAKIGAYYNHDDGWFTNAANGSKFGGGKRYILRGALRWVPTDSVDIVLRVEHGDDRENNGAVTQNRAVYKSGFALASTPGIGGGPARWTSGTLEANFDVGFGNGKITSITGYRKYNQVLESDIDGLVANQFNTTSYIKQDQFSQELRYAGTFGVADVTAGLYYFRQYLQGIDQRFVLGGVSAGGGDVRAKTYSGFMALDLHVSDEFTINLGGRYNSETKDANVTSFGAGRCNVVARTCIPEFKDQATFKSFIPKVGFQWKPDKNVMFYAFYTKGYRSGGYNLRNSVIGASPGPFDDEKQNAVEAGIKADVADGRLRFNASAFQYKIKNAQRTVTVPDPRFGVLQLIRNSADETVRGVELEATARIAKGLSLNGSVGVTTGSYDRVIADLNGDGKVDGTDQALIIPRLIPLTYSIGADYKRDVGVGVLRATVSYAYDDKSFFCDNNVSCRISSVRLLDGSIGLGLLDDKLRLSVYARNLLNDVNETTIAPLPAVFGGAGASITGLARGRVFGASAEYRF